MSEKMTLCTLEMNEIEVHACMESTLISTQHHFLVSMELLKMNSHGHQMDFSVRLTFMDVV